MKILIADDLPTSAIDLLSKEGWTVDAQSGRSVEQLTADIADADAIVVRSATKVTAALINAAPRLRAIARAGTGVDNVDVPAASARGIVVMNAPGASSISVAELTMGLLLSLARHMPGADAAMKQGKWEKKKFQGSELRGKTLGLVGLGRIGQEVARRATAFEMRIIAFDPFLPPQAAADLDVELVALDDLFAQADYVSLHMPSTPQTRNLVNAERLANAKKGLRLVNTARGDLVDEAALADAIEGGQVAGAALDVFVKEPTVDHRLQNLPQVVATPHIAASTAEGQELVGVETAAALRDFLRDGVVRNAVNVPSVSPDEFKRLQPFLTLGERLGSFLAQMIDRNAQELSVRYYGDLASGRTDMVANAIIVGLLRPILSPAVTFVNARQVAAERGPRSGRIAQHACARLPGADLGEAPDARRRPVGGRRGVRARVGTPGDAGWRGRGGAPRGNDDRHLQQRSAGRHRRPRHDSRASRREHRQLRARPRRHARRRPGGRRRVGPDYGSAARGNSRPEEHQDRAAGRVYEALRSRVAQLTGGRRMTRPSRMSTTSTPSSSIRSMR